MQDAEKAKIPKSKSQLHKRNIHKTSYNFEDLVQVQPTLKEFVITNKYGTETIDFSKAKAVKELNTALLKFHYNISFWQIPEGYLCPPIPGRVDYLHHAADLLAASNEGEIPIGNTFRCIDIGTGSNCIYPLVGASIYGWQFTGTEIDENALAAADENVRNNPSISHLIDLKLQLNSKDIYYGTLRREDFYEISICNPPFHSSAAEAIEANKRKVRNLSGKKVNTTALNFGGKQNELWCDGGEKRFIQNMMRQSEKFKENILWFTTLVSKENHLKQLNGNLAQYKPTDVKVIDMGQGNKKSRILAWTFLNKVERTHWMNQRKE